MPDVERRENNELIRAGGWNGWLKSSHLYPAVILFLPRNYEASIFPYIEVLSLQPADYAHNEKTQIQ
jgi:hypothetical protein